MVRPETYYLNPMECTTSDGVVNVFREIAVISRWEINQNQKHFCLHLDRRKKCTESPVYSLEREKVRNLVQTFGVDIKQVLPYVFAPHKNQILSKKCQSLPFSEQKNRFFCTIEWLKASKHSAQTIPSTRSSTPSSSTWESQSRFFPHFCSPSDFFSVKVCPRFSVCFFSFIFSLNQPSESIPVFSSFLLLLSSFLLS